MIESPQNEQAEPVDRKRTSNKDINQRELGNNEFDEE